LSFFVGLGVIYAVLQTRFEYLAEHQFFYNRMQPACIMPARC
jgi:hypothetical protein